MSLCVQHDNLFLSVLKALQQKDALFPVKPIALCTQNIVGIHSTLYLSNQEVHIILDEDIQLLLEDGLHLRLALTAQVGGCLGHAPCHQGIPLFASFPG